VARGVVSKQDNVSTTGAQLTVEFGKNLRPYCTRHPCIRIGEVKEWQVMNIVETSRLGGLANNEASLITAIEITQQKNSQAVFWNFTSGWLVTGTC